MKIGIPRETLAGETRVAAIPATVRELVAAGHRLIVERGAGVAAGVTDEAFAEAGAALGNADDTFSAEIVLKVRAPTQQEIAGMQRGAALIGILNRFDAENSARLASAGVNAFALEAAPRTTRAQSMDVLSSQANIAGYKAVLLAANLYQRFMSMLMTAAGTVKAARVVVLGAGVAGLQAIATAKRLGAVVEASDVRPAAKEQVESLGAKFISVPFETDEERDIANGAHGYARQMPAAWLARQSQLVTERLKQADIVISTALIPGRAAPLLISEDAVMGMRPGSVIIDLAAGHGAETDGRRGGNCALSVTDEVVAVNGVLIAGYSNLASMVAADASALYAKNVLNFLKLILDKDGGLVINTDDDIVSSCLMCHEGQIRHAV